MSKLEKTNRDELKSATGGERGHILHNTLKKDLKNRVYKSWADVSEMENGDISLTETEANPSLTETDISNRR